MKVLDLKIYRLKETLYYGKIKNITNINLVNLLLMMDSNVITKHLKISLPFFNTKIKEYKMSFLLNKEFFSLIKIKKFPLLIIKIKIYKNSWSLQSILVK